MKEIITSGFGKINWRDIFHGLIVAVGTGVSDSLLQWASALQEGKFVALDYKTIGLTALSGGIAYLVKKLFTPAQVITKA